MTKLRKCIDNATTGLDAIQRAPIVDFETGLHCLRIQDISQSKSFDDWGYTSANIEEVRNFLIKNGDMFMARTGSTIGCNFYANKDMNSVFNNGLIRLRTNSQMLPQYLSYLMQTRSFRTFVNNVGMASATQPNIKINDLLDYEFALPELNVQQHIVNTIGTVDDLIEKYEEIMMSIKSVRSHLFAKYKSLSVSEDEILNHITLENGAQPPKEQHVYEEKEGYVRFVQNRDYDSDSHLTYIPISKKNHLCNKFDIMMDKYGDAGAIRYGITGAFNVALLKIVPVSPNEKEYIRDFFSLNEIKAILFASSQASTRPSLNEATFKGINIQLPNKAMLEHYQEKASALLNLEFDIKSKVAKLREIKQKLLTKYF